MSTARPKPVSSRALHDPTCSIACSVPVSSSTPTQASAMGEKRSSAAASSRVRSLASRRRVAAGTANSRANRPPIHTLIARTWATSSGKRSATGDWTLAWPPSAGATARKAAGIAASASGRAGRRGRGGASVSASTPPSARKASTRRPQTCPKRVPSTSPTTSGESADQALVAPAVAPCRTIPAQPATTPAAAATSSAARRRRANADAASPHASPVPAAARRAGRQTASRNARPPRTSAVAR